MTDDQVRGHAAIREGLCGRQQVGHIRGEVRVLKLSVGMAKTRKVKTQYRNAKPRKAGRDTAGCGDVFGTCKAMCEKRRGKHGTFWQIKTG